MKDYIEHNKKSLEDWQYNITLWHIGQMYAFADDYNTAVKYFSKPSVLNSSDEEWKLYALGTIAYLKRNIKELKKNYNRLSKISADDNPNLGILKTFLDNPYKENY